MSRFDTMASISSRLSLGTTTSSGLRRRDHAADGVDRELLHHAVDRSGQVLKPGPLLGLDQVLGQPVRLLLGLGQFVGERMPVFRRRLAAGLADRGDRRFGLVQMALLNA